VSNFIKIYQAVPKLLMADTQTDRETGDLISLILFLESRLKEERDHWEDQGVGGKMGSEWILGRLAWGVWIEFDWLRTETGGGLL
jgi:hypothetical protein